MASSLCAPLSTIDDNKTDDPLSLGVSFELDPQVADELRQRDEERKIKQQQKHSDGSGVEDEDDAWEDVLMLPPHVQQKLEQEEEEKQELDNEESTTDDDEEDVLSLSPPPSLPILLIDTERLLGYRPSDPDEVILLQQQLQDSMWGMEDDRNMKGSEEENSNAVEGCDSDVLDIQVSRDFETRVSDLLDNKAARHSDTQARDWGDTDKTGLLIRLEYPPFFCAKQLSGNNADVQVAKTQRLWKVLLQPHPVPVVDRLLTHLRNCSRCLSWKIALRQEVRQLARNEHQRQLRYQQQCELQVWRSGQRKQRLDKLYQVRETLESRVEMARARWKELSEERDRTVAWKLRQQRLLQREYGRNNSDSAMMAGIGGLEGFDFGSTSLFAFPNSGAFLGGSAFQDDDSDGGFNLISDGEYEEESSYGRDDPENEGNNDEEEPKTLRDENEEADFPSPTATRDEAASPTDDVATEGASDADVLGKKGQLQRLREKKKKTVERELRLQEAAQEMEHKQKLEWATAQEESMIHACTSEEMRTTEGVLLSLEERLAKVDELLETLQEEEWADQEEGIEDEGGAVPDDDGIPTQQPELPSFTLLDQILAMVLGALLPPHGTTDLSKHVHWLNAEHQSIAQEWQLQFGRLPPPLELGKREHKRSAPAFVAQNNAGKGSDTVVRDNKLRTHASSAATKTADELREELGIEHMETENWEDNDDEGDKDVSGLTPLRPPEPATKPPTAAKRKTGLRPGGSVD